MKIPALLLLATLALSGCGYRVGSHSELMPATIKTIAIPAFTNNTTRYKLTESLPGAIGREFISRSRYKIVADPNQADALLTGSVVNYMSSPTIFDQRSGRASGILVMVFLNLKLTDRASGKVLYERNGYEARGRYEVAVDQQQYFDESSTALARLSGEVARQVVSSILEAF